MLQPPSTGSQDQNDAARLVPLDRLQGSLGQRVYQSLKHAILTLAYRPGDIIRKPEICDRLGVSRSPVADAVARLAADGLVDVVPQAGTFVTRLSMTDIREGAFIREAIEVAAAERVAEQVTDDQLRDLRRNLRLQEALAADGDQQGFMGLDGQMHDMMLSFTGFPRLPQVSQTAWLSRPATDPAGSRPPSGHARRASADPRGVRGTRSPGRPSGGPAPLAPASDLSSAA